MKRINTATKATDLFGLGKHGFKDGDLANGVAPTDLVAAWFNDVQEELCQVIEGAGIALDGNSRTQLLKSVRRMAGGNVRTVTAGNTVLTVDDAGLVLVNATAGAVTMTLPQANVLKAVPFKFQRIDATANMVTVYAAGVDVIDDPAVSFTLAGKANTRKIVSDGVTSWHSDINGLTQAQADARYIQLSNTETGKIVSFMRTTAPTGYIKANGRTIGSAASGATNRANADTLALFTLLWTEFDNTVLPIQTSAGAPTGRGASAATDWAANKRLPVFDRRGNFGRGWDDGAGVDPGRVLGSWQADEVRTHNHVNGGHTNLLRPPYAGSLTGRDSDGSGSEQAVGSGDSAPMLAYGGTETRPSNIAELVCIKL